MSTCDADPLSKKERVSMAIRAFLKDGQIKLAEPLPADWTEGLELSVQPLAAAVVGPTEVAATEEPVSEAELAAWADEVERSARAIPPEEHARFIAAIAEHEAWSKRAVSQASEHRVSTS